MRKSEPYCNVAHQALLCNYDLPQQRLQYDTKTPLLMPHERDPNTIGPLPPNAAVDLYNRTAWIPGEEWQFFIPKERIRLSGVPREAIRYDYSVANVQRSTTVREITNDIGKWLLGSTTDIAAVTSACSVELVFWGR